MILETGLPIESELINKTKVLGNDYYGEITEVKRVEE